MILVRYILACCMILVRSNYFFCTGLGILQRSQRDVSQNKTIDQLTYSGVNLNTVIWDQEGYTTSTLTYIPQILDSGANILVMDIYWNEKWRNWQLCPELLLPNVTQFDKVQRLGNYKCEMGLNLTRVFDTINTYLDQTNTVTSADFFELVFNVKSLDPSYKYGVSSSNNTLSYLLQNYADHIYSPADWQDDLDNNLIESTPTFDFILYEKYKRMIPIVMTNDMQVNSSYGSLQKQDSLNVFIDGYNLNLTRTFNLNNNFQESSNSGDFTSTITRLSKEPFRMFFYNMSTAKFNSSTFQNYLRQGFSTILNRKLESQTNISSILNGSLWSWAQDQPSTKNTVAKLFPNVTTSHTRQVANRCAVMYKGSWYLDNCYNERRWACVNETDNFDWIVTDHEDSRSYFADMDCPLGFVFDIPKSSLENLALQNYFSRKNIDEPVWIDMNSISVSDCWVTGGPYATCPYESVVTKKLFVGMITPLSVVSLILLILIIALKFDNVPIQKNRRRWKKLTNEFKERDYEGVPS